jgi:hypothetical protein
MTKWDPSVTDATSFAAFRWFANAIENEALELYATDKAQFGRIEEVLRRTLKDMGAIRQTTKTLDGENPCPDGWVLCDGVCKPSCDGEAEAAAGMSIAKRQPAGATKKTAGGKKR